MTVPSSGGGFIQQPRKPSFLDILQQQNELEASKQRLELQKAQEARYAAEAQAKKDAAIAEAELRTKTNDVLRMGYNGLKYEMMIAQHQRDTAAYEAGLKQYEATPEAERKGPAPTKPKDLPEPPEMLSINEVRERLFQLDPDNAENMLEALETGLSEFEDRRQRSSFAAMFAGLNTTIENIGPNGQYDLGGLLFQRDYAQILMQGGDFAEARLYAESQAKVREAGDHAMRANFIRGLPEWEAFAVLDDERLLATYANMQEAKIKEQAKLVPAHLKMSREKYVNMMMPRIMNGNFSSDTVLTPELQAMMETMSGQLFGDQPEARPTAAAARAMAEWMYDSLTTESTRMRIRAEVDEGIASFMEGTPYAMVENAIVQNMTDELNVYIDLERSGKLDPDDLQLLADIDAQIARHQRDPKGAGLFGLGKSSKEKIKELEAQRDRVFGKLEESFNTRATEMGFKLGSGDTGVDFDASEARQWLGVIASQATKNVDDQGNITYAFTAQTTLDARDLIKTFNSTYKPLLERYIGRNDRNDFSQQDVYRDATRQYFASLSDNERQYILSTYGVNSVDDVWQLRPTQESAILNRVLTALRLRLHMESLEDLGRSFTGPTRGPRTPRTFESSSLEAEPVIEPAPTIPNQPPEFRYDYRGGEHQ